MFHADLLDARAAGHQSTDLLLAPLHGRLLVLRLRLQSGGGPSEEAPCEKCSVREINVKACFIEIWLKNSERKIRGSLPKFSRYCFYRVRRDSRFGH